MSFTEDEDKDEDDLLFQHCRKDLQALRQVCHSYGYGDDDGYDDGGDDGYDDGDNNVDGDARDNGYQHAEQLQNEGKDLLPYSSIVDDDDDDDFILLSVQKRLGTTISTASSSSYHRCTSKTVPTVSRELLDSQSLEEEDDDAILQAVRKRFGSFNVPTILSGSVKKFPPKEKKKDRLPRESKRIFSSATQNCMNNSESATQNCMNNSENVFTEDVGSPFSISKEALLKADGKKKRHVLTNKQEPPVSLAKNEAEGEALVERHICPEAKDSTLNLEKDDVNNHKNISVEAVTISDISTELCHSIIPRDCKEEHAGFTFPGQAEMFDYSLESFPYEPVDGIVLNNNSNNTPDEFSAEQRGKSIRNTLEALKKNRLLQKVLTKKLQLIQSKLQENSRLKKQVRSLVEVQNITNRCLSLNIVNHAVADCFSIGSKGKTLHVDGRHAQCKPPSNSDVARLKPVLRDYSCDGVPKSWTRQEKDELLKGLKQQIQENRIHTAMKNFKSESNDMSILDGQLKAITEQELTPHDIRAALPLINWEEVARMYVVNRSPIECWIQWLNHEDPLIERGPWTKAEDKRLWSIARNNKLSNWEKIAQELGGHRSVAQCLIRYQRSLNAGIVRSAWTAEEDKQLRAAIQVYGDKDWQAIAATLECRTSAQCWNRWTKTLHPLRKKSGKWDIVEDKRLKIAVSICGPRNWNMIATHVPGRTGVQCRERWCNVLDPSLSYEGWTEEEDEKLNQAVIKHGFRWSTVSNDLKPRTDNQCWRRWKILHPNDVLEMQKNNKIQKIALLSNFVGRKKERPTLQSSDFIPQGTGYHKDDLGQVKHKRPRITKSTLQRNGTTAFMRFVREVARVSRYRGSKQDDASQVSSSINDTQIISEKSDLENIACAERLIDGTVSSKERNNESESSAKNLDPSETSCEMENQVEAAVRALFSWPFFWGLQDAWRRQQEN